MSKSCSDNLVRGRTWSPNNKAERRDIDRITLLAVVAVNTDHFLTLVEVDVGEGPVATLRADPLDSTLVFIEVDVTDHGAELDSGGDVIDPVMAVFVVVERLCVQNQRSDLLIKTHREEGTSEVLADNFEGCYDAKSVLLVPYLSETHLLRIRHRFEDGLGRPLKVKHFRLVEVRFKKWQLADTVLLQLQST